MEKDIDFKSEAGKLHYEPSRHLCDFHLAGFAYYDGIDVIDELSVGKDVKLIAEMDNPHDSEAVAIYYNDKKIGYIPSEKNTWISKMLYFGHDIFEAKIQYKNDESHPERQFRVVIRIKDNRQKNLK